MLLGTLGAGLLGNILAAKVLIRTGGALCTLWLILVKYYQNEPNFLKFIKKVGFQKEGVVKTEGNV